jgi:P27 family predicted phage terminase small subunit
MGGLSFKSFEAQTVRRFFGDAGSSCMIKRYIVVPLSSQCPRTRERKTIQEKMLSGTLRGDRLRADDFEKNDATAMPCGRPKMPAHLSPEAVEAWKNVCKLLRAKNTLAKTDAATLEVYCEVKATWIAAKADVVKRGQLIDEKRFSKSGDPYTVTIINPSVQIQRDSERQLLQLTKALGLAPDSREKVRRTRKVKTESDENTALMKAFPFLLTPKKADEEEDEEDAERTDQ